MNDSSINAGSRSDYNPNVRRSIGVAGEDVLNTRDTGITGGTGSGYNPNTRIDQHDITSDTDLNDDEGMIAEGSVSQIGSGYDTNIRGAEMTSRETGSGLTDNDSDGFWLRLSHTRYRPDWWCLGNGLKLRFQYSPYRPSSSLLLLITYYI